MVLSVWLFSSSFGAVLFFYCLFARWARTTPNTVRHPPFTVMRGFLALLSLRFPYDSHGTVAEDKIRPT